jgi:hypothetical protein
MGEREKVEYDMKRWEKEQQKVNIFFFMDLLDRET